MSEGQQAPDINQDIGWMLWSLRQLGRKVRRKGWNGKGMFLVLVPGSTFEVTADRPFGKIMPEMIGKEAQYHAHVDIYTAKGYFVPWSCSQEDLLATDWEWAD